MPFLRFFQLSFFFNYLNKDIGLGFQGYLGVIWSYCAVTLHINKDDLYEKKKVLL